jgi:hypothetical protein
MQYLNVQSLFTCEYHLSMTVESQIHSSWSIEKILEIYLLNNIKHFLVDFYCNISLKTHGGQDFVDRHYFTSHASQEYTKHCMKCKLYVNSYW